MLRCLRACAEAAYGAKRTSDTAVSGLVSSAFEDTFGPQVRTLKWAHLSLKGHTSP